MRSINFFYKKGVSGRFCHFNLIEATKDHYFHYIGISIFYMRAPESLSTNLIVVV